MKPFDAFLTVRANAFSKIELLMVRAFEFFSRKTMKFRPKIAPSDRRSDKNCNERVGYGTLKRKISSIITIL